MKKMKGYEYFARHCIYIHDKCFSFSVDFLDRDKFSNLTSISFVEVPVLHDMDQ